MLATDVASAAATWRPQLYGDGRASGVDDPLVEPLWTGPRVLALVAGGDARLTDADGEPVPAPDAVVAALVDAVAAGAALVEGVLTAEPLQALGDIAARDQPSLPKAGQVMSQMVIGDRGDRKDRLVEHVDEARRRTSDPAAEDVAFVAVDLLWLDDESLCDVPLLERKRILESVVAESHLVRVGTYVKPPIDTWLGAWRAFGFRRISFKAANSRYVPGTKNAQWSIAEIPRR